MRRRKEVVMMDWSEVLPQAGYAVGVLTSVCTGLGAVMYHKQTRRLKEAETRLAEVNVSKAKVETRAEEWHIWRDQAEAMTAQNLALIERNDQLVRMNAEKEDRHADDLREKEERFKNQTGLLRKVQRELVETLEREKEHVRREAELQRMIDHLEQWKCIRPWNSCKEREPEQTVKPDHYLPLLPGTV